MDTILEKGSSLNAGTQLAVDASFAALLVVLLGLLAATRSFHFAFLSVVEIGLWVAVKWVVQGLREEREAQEAEKQAKSE